MSNFPKDFVWGAASSAYQIEGEPLADGGGVSIWDTFSHTPGKTYEGNTGDIACGSYAHPEWDLENLQAIGLHAYRFSTSWARIDPKGDGNWNEAGLRYYDKVVDGLLNVGIEPYMTLYHWELPQALEDQGGWMNEDTARAFGRFAGMMARRFQGRVRHYFVLNEPQCSIGLGYGTGVHAPGKQLPDLFQGMKDMLLAYGLAAKAIRKADGDALVGLATTGRLCYPQTEQDVDVARTLNFSADDDGWVFNHAMFLDPVCFGRFPETLSPELKEKCAGVTAEEMAIIHEKPDFLGFNIYNGWAVRQTPEGPEWVERREGFPRTLLKWPVTPEVLDWGPYLLWERYQMPCYITENGLSCHDWVSLDGKVHDPNRIDFLHRYLLALDRCIARGADIRGYFHWALTDNFEWHTGYADRFGLVFVDYPSQRRILKDSARWYAETVRENGKNL